MENSELRILLVDDDEDERVTMADLLNITGLHFDLIWVPTYEQGLKIILAGECDVCLVDYRLGERSGLDLLAAAKAKADHAQIILLTGGGDRSIDLSAANAGAADYLVKGELTAALLDRSIRYALERGRAIAALRDASESQSLNIVKSAFLRGMSHEMRTPLNAVLGMAHMLSESPLNDEQKAYLEVLSGAGSSLLGLISDILDLASIEAGHLDLVCVEFDLKEVVEQVVELKAAGISAKGSRLLCHFAPGLATQVIGDPMRLRQILTSLLDNANKFTHAGQILLVVQSHGSGETHRFEFTVSDTGIGIPAEKLATIFEDFTQADASLTRKYGGTGLGLGISRRLVEAMGGNLTVVSSVGQGSTFRFAIPFDQAPKSTPVVWMDDGEKERAPGKLAAKLKLLETSSCRHSLAQGSYTPAFSKILVVDDSLDNQMLIKAYLRGGPYQVTFEENGQAALDRFATTNFDLILMDIQMPVMDGLAATRGIRAVERKRGSPSTQILALTANESAQAKQASKQPGGLRCSFDQAYFENRVALRHRKTP
jgi:signal transduction histidine kinase